ncbi:ashwin-like [Mizuhopecten yessoensis]|uniref:ashwin-like n=1 Tax=Mizuhopecten yessoensis TaxID=6573 RepID=UPI000B45779A|nr:ashwin-like [Mizuhopecten yessoensis]
MAATQQDDDRKQQFDWLYPELLSKDGLLDILKQRYVSHSNLESLEKDDLVELYYKYVIPLPQRKYKMNRRGREMTRKQIMLAKKRKIVAPDETEPAKKKRHEDNTVNSRFITSFNDPSKAESRLKPPPSCIDLTKKTIKLGSSSKPSATENNDSKNDTDSPPTKKKIKLITFSSSEITPTVCIKEKSPAISPPVTSPTKDVLISRIKTISLINQHLTTSETGAKEKPKTSADNNSTTCESPNNSTTEAKEESPEKESSETFKSKKKIKIARIPWP